MPVFLGRACTSFQDTGIAGTELTLFSHSKKHEKGKLSVQLSFEVPQVSNCGCGFRIPWTPVFDGIGMQILF